VHVDAERSAVGLVMPHEVNGERIVQLFGVLTIPEIFFSSVTDGGAKKKSVLSSQAKIDSITINW